MRLLESATVAAHAFFSNIRRKVRWDIDGPLSNSVIYIVAESRHIFISVISPFEVCRL